MARRNTVLLSSGILVFAALFSLLFSSQAIGAIDHRFDVDTYYGSYPDLWDSLNTYTTDGNHHYMAVQTNEHEDEIVAAGNGVCAYWNDMNAGWPGGGGEYGTVIAETVSDYFDGDPPTWIILNEIRKDGDGTNGWNNSSAYRTYVKYLVKKLDDLGYNPIVCSQSMRPTTFGDSWQFVASYGFIGIEHYLSGCEIVNTYDTIAKCQEQYQDSETCYNNLGVSSSRLMLIENFQGTGAGSGYGRGGVTNAQWSSAIHKRAQASHNIGFVGFVGYSWTNLGSYSENDQCIAVGAASVYKPF